MSRYNDLSSKPFKRAETNLQGKLKDYFLTHYSHFLVPGFNTCKTPFIERWDVENVMGLHQEFPYHCDYPRPLLPPVKMGKNDVDPALQLIATKSQINDDVNRILDHYQKHRKSFGSLPLKHDTKWKEKDGSVQATLPRYIADLAVMMEMDPDPHFSGKYNWYYSGGSLDTVVMGGQNLLLFPYMGDLVATPLTSKPSGLWKPNLQKATSCGMDGTFYELKKVVQNGSCRILGRSKYHCDFYSVSEDNGKLRMLHLDQQHSKLPYISAALDPTNCNRFSTVDVERIVTLWDMVSRKKITSNTVDLSKVLESKWGSLRFDKSDPNTLVFTDNCCVHYLDTRQPFDRPVLTLCPKANLNSCESLCLEVPSRSENHSYVASYHSLLMCDRRAQPQECAQQKWVHQFKSAPIFAAVRTRDEKEVVVLSSQLAGETAIIVNTWDSCENPFSCYMPYTPHSILETLRETQLQGKCLDPSLRKRLELSTAGSTLVENENGDLSLFLQNSIGDIFYQCISHDEEPGKFSLVNGQSYYAMEAWEKRILLQDREITPLVITERSNMHHVFANFTDKSLILERDAQPSELLRNPKWKESLEMLRSYVDILAPELLAVWEVTDDNVPVAQSAVPHQKVMNWLEMASQKYPVQSQELQSQEPELRLTPVNTQELFGVSQQAELIDIAEDAPQESYYPPVKVKTSRKPPAKKKTYVAGF